MPEAQETESNLPENWTPKPNGSKILGVSVAGWLAIILTITVCLMNLTNLYLVSMGITGGNVRIEEPLYSGFMAALGFYLGKQNK